MTRVVPTTRLSLLPCLVSFLSLLGTGRQTSSISGFIVVVAAFIPEHRRTKTRTRRTTRRIYQKPLSTRPHPSSSSSAVIQFAAEEATASAMAEDDDNSKDQSSSPSSPSVLSELVEQSLNLPSKVRWKKKRHLMMEDVKSTIRKQPHKAPRKVEEMIHRMLHMSELYEEEKQERDVVDDEDGTNNFFHPTTECYNLWIHAIAKSGLDNAGQMAEEVMENHMKSHNVQPNGITYSTIIDAYANSNHQESVSTASTSTKSSSGAMLAEEFLYRLLSSSSSSSGSISASASVVLHSVSCDTILNAWAQQGTQESAERALSILHSMERFDAEVAKGLAKSTVDIHPTKYSYASVMSAFAKVGSTEAAEEASELLKHMLMRLNDTNHKHSGVAPDTVVFNAAIHAWASSNDPRAGKRAADLLEQMKVLSTKYDTMPDLKTYNTVISAWAHSGDKNGAPQTERLVQEMQNIQNKRNKNTSGTNDDDDDDDDDETNDSLVVADTVTYNSLLLAWSRSPLPGAAERIEKILEYMIKSGNKDIAPDTVSFSTVMDCVAKSKEPNKARRTRALLDRLEQLYKESGRRDLRSTTISYNTVLNACAFSALGTSEEERREAMTIAVRTFGSMDSSYPSRFSSKYASVAPDTVTYGNMLKCIANLVPKGDVRNSMAIKVFNKCCDDGLVGPLVWNEIRRAVPMKLLHDTLGLKRHVGSLQVTDLPTEWTMNNRSDKKKKELMNTRRNNKKHQSSRHDKDKDKDSNKKKTNKAFLVEPSYSNKDMIF
mmetsp:Transcript_6082/g.15127  ORF Transcript_6082/g.15127 Transcript_6082/m.15127 type:complete len:773 (-) Transcript_6082:127-2445(-)